MTQGFYRHLPGQPSSNFLIDVAKGLVPGHSIRPNVSTKLNAPIMDFGHIWGGSSDMIYPIAAESWEIVSTSANDATGGTGARQVLVNSIDDNYSQQNQIVTLNGTTPVPLTGTHFRPDGAVVIESGSLKWNDGDIVIRVAGGGNPRQYILQEQAASQDSHITVPANKTYHVIKSIFAFPKDGDGAGSSRIRFFGTNTDIASGFFPFYQSATIFDLLGEFVLPPRTDFYAIATATNPLTTVNSVSVFLEIENEVLP